MSEQTYDQGQPTDDSTANVAADQAKGVAQDAKQSGAQVAGTAKEETRQVAGEAKQQAKDLYEQVRGELGDQTATQQERAASGLHSLGDELGTMANGSEQSGVAADLARQASERAHSIAGWLESRNPGDVVDELRRFARRNPGTFVAAAAVLGLLGGRLTRGLKEERDDRTGAGYSDTGTRYTGTGTGTSFTGTSAGYRDTGTGYSVGYSGSDDTGASQREAGYSEPSYAGTGQTEAGYPEQGYQGTSSAPVVTTTEDGETFTHTTGSGTGGFEEGRR